MPRTLIFAIVLLVASGAGRVAPGQVSSSGLLAPNVLRQNGLERVWHTQIEVDRGRGHVIHVTPYINQQRAHSLYEVQFGQRQYLISERDLDPFGKPLGIDGARLRAEDKITSLKSQYPNASDEPTSRLIVVPEITLYATTSRGAVHAIDGETGKTRWVASVGKATFPTTEAAANDDYVAVVNGSNLYALNAVTGDFEWQLRVAGVPGAGPALSDQYVFVPMVGGELESYSMKNPKNPPWVYRALGRAMTQPATGLGSVAWPTDRGHLYVAATTNRSIRYRLEARNTMSSSPVFSPPDRLLVTSIDGFVYCLNPFRQTSNIRWQVSTGESISRSPVCFGDVCYFVTDSHRLMAVRLEDGMAVWDSPVTGIKEILAASKERLYVVGDVGRLVILEVATGARVAGIPTIEYDLHVQNPLTDRLYIGTRGGLLQCLRETGEQWPQLHQKVEAAVKPKPQVQQQPAGGEEPGGPGRPAEIDPFGGPAGKAKTPATPDDPFGAPAGKPAGKGKPDDDPFG